MGYFVFCVLLSAEIYADDLTISTGENFLEAAKKYLGAPFVWDGRSKQRLDCMGLIFLAYTDITGESWQNLSVLSSKLVSGKKLGSPVKGLNGVLKNDIDYSKLKKGDILYFLVTTEIYDTDPPLVTIDSIPYYVWHMGIFAGFDTTGCPLCLNARPGDKVVIEPLGNIYFERLFVTRLDESREERAEMIETLKKLMRDNQPIIIYTFVALCDNKHQGIVPVSPILGNGEDPKNNLYWGAGGGVKTYFRKSRNWDLIATISNISANILERCIFKRQGKNIYMIADAYKGSAIKDAILDFLNMIAKDTILQMAIPIPAKNTNGNLEIRGSVQLVCYVGHNGLLDFTLDSLPQPAKNKMPKDVVILACLSKNSFYDILDSLGGYPLLWTEGLLAPEAYTLESAIEGWIALEDNREIESRAERTYNRFQKCGLNGARKIFTTGW